MKRENQQRIVETSTKMIMAGLARASEFAGMLQDFDKPAGERCPHQRHDGCKVYAQRPFGCRYWNCRWLVDDAGDTSRPDRAGYVIDVIPDFVTAVGEDGVRTNIEVIQIWVDPKRPDAWRDNALFAYLERRSKEGKAALIRFNSRDAVTLMPPSMSADRRWHEIAHDSVRAERTAEERFEGLAQCYRGKLEGTS
jgi:hypothetical protein